VALVITKTAILFSISGGGALALLGQALPDSDAALKWVVSGGGYGILAWYLYYNTAIAIPRIVSEFREEMATARADHAESRQAYMDGLRAMTDSVRHDKRGF
jgi:hypothetical protein